MTNVVIISMLAAAVTAGTPVLFAALGEVLAERAGILNLGVEGMMLMGAVVGFAVTMWTGNPTAGFVAAMAAGMCLGMVHGGLCISLRANQVVAGMALTIFGMGLSGYLGKSLVGVPPVARFSPVKLPLLGDIPILGPIFFQHDVLVYFSYLLVPALWYLVFRTRPGLHMRSVGENPRAADVLGINVVRLRYLYTSVGGALAGAGGAYLALAYAPSWLENMTAGRGWIAIALVIFSGWNPLVAMAGAYLFGGVEAASVRIQAVGATINPYFLSMTPYLLTILALILAGRSRRRAAPAALSVAYDREG